MYEVNSLHITSLLCVVNINVCLVIDNWLESTNDNIDIVEEFNIGGLSDDKLYMSSYKLSSYEVIDKIIVLFCTWPGLANCS